MIKSFKLKTLTKMMVMLIIFSCQNKKQRVAPSIDFLSMNESKKQAEFLKNPIIYLSGGNDMASIKLTLASNRTFEFVMKILDEKDTLKSKGNWTENKDRFSLVFDDKNNLNLYYLFDSKNNDGGNFEIINDNTVLIKKDAEQLFIWGVNCFKKE